MRATTRRDACFASRGPCLLDPGHSSLYRAPGPPPLETQGTHPLHPSRAPLKSTTFVRTVAKLVLRTRNSGTKETDGFFRQARRRPAAVWGIRQGAATTPGGKRRRFMFRYFWFATLVPRSRLLLRRHLFYMNGERAESSPETLRPPGKVWPTIASRLPPRSWSLFFRYRCGTSRLTGCQAQPAELSARQQEKIFVDKVALISSSH